MSQLPKRYTTFPLPTRRYIPGEGIHPSRHPQGSHIPQLPEEPQPFSDSTWQNSPRYLYAIDLFNSGYYWEAHEVLEELWVRVGRATPTGQFLQGLIQIAAAVLKKAQNKPQPARRLLDKGLAKLKPHNATYLGINSAALTEDLERFFAGESVGLPGMVLRNFDGK